LNRVAVGASRLRSLAHELAHDALDLDLLCLGLAPELDVRYDVPHVSYSAAHSPAP
jgi:hypothetical protein